MKIITQNYENDKKVSSSIMNFFKKYKVSSILKASNAYKTKGIPVIKLFQYLFSLIFANRSVYEHVGKRNENFAKRNTVYIDS